MKKTLLRIYIVAGLLVCVLPFAAMASAPELYISVISVRSCAPTYPAARARAANVEMIFFIIIERVYLLFFNNKSRNANLIKNVYICI